MRVATQALHDATDLAQDTINRMTCPDPHYQNRQGRALPEYAKGKA